MSKVYVITKGEYSSYHICAVTLEKDKAEMLAKLFSDSMDTAEIEEFDTDVVSRFLEHKRIYLCYYWEYKNEITVRKTDNIPNDFAPHKTCNGAYVYVAADDEPMALKKASDLFAKFRAQELEL